MTYRGGEHLKSLIELRYWHWSRPKEKLLRWLVWKLPKTLVFQCAIRVIANATTGEYRNQEVPALTAMQALERWDAK